MLSDNTWEHWRIPGPGGSRRSWPGSNLSADYSRIVDLQQEVYYIEMRKIILKLINY